jgi:hypothetical protein
VGEWGGIGGVSAIDVAVVVIYDKFHVLGVADVPNGSQVSRRGIWCLARQEVHFRAVENDPSLHESWYAHV